MPVGTSGLSTTPVPVSGASGTDNLIEMMKFFSNKDAVAARIADFVAKEAEVDAKIALVGGIEQARDLIAEAEAIRRQADVYRVEAINAGEEAADKLETAARIEREAAEALRKRAQKEFAEREAKVEADERDILKRQKAAEQVEALLKSGQERVKIAQREADEQRDLFQGKVAATKKIWQ